MISKLWVVPAFFICLLSYKLGPVGDLIWFAGAGLFILALAGDELGKVAPNESEEG